MPSRITPHPPVRLVPDIRADFVQFLPLAEPRDIVERIQSGEVSIHDCEVYVFVSLTPRSEQSVALGHVNGLYRLSASARSGLGLWARVHEFCHAPANRLDVGLEL